MNKTIVYNELSYINEHFEFSPDCSLDLQDYLKDNYLVDVDPDSDLVFVTPEAELTMGVSKEDLRDKYEDEDEYETY